MELSKNKKLTAFIGCFITAMVVQLSTQAINNITNPILSGMGRGDLFVIAATLSGLGMAVMTPIGGKLGDLYGRAKIVLISGIITFVLHVALAFITSPVLWVVVRTVIPFSIGMSLSIPFALPAELYPESYSQKVGIISGALAAGIIIGSYGGGTLYSAGLGKLAVIIPGVVSLIGAILISAAAPKRSAQNVKLDMGGIICLFIFLTALGVVLSFASTWGYGSITSIIGYVIIVASLIALIAVEQKVEDPCLPFSLFKNRTFLFLILFATCGSMYQYVMQVYTPLYGQTVLGLTPAVTGSFQLPRSIICIIAPLICAAVIKHNPRSYKINLAVSSAITILCFVLMLIPGLNMSTAVIYIALALTGIGEGLKSVSSNPLAITTLEPKNIGIGIALVSAMASIGNQSAAAIVGAVFNANLAKGMAAAVFSTYYVVIGITALSLLFILCVKTAKPEDAAEN